MAYGEGEIPSLAGRYRIKLYGGSTIRILRNWVDVGCYRLSYLEISPSSLQIDKEIDFHHTCSFWFAPQAIDMVESDNPGDLFFVS